MRRILLALVAAAAAAMSSLVAQSPVEAREVVTYRGEGQPGMVVVRLSERRLYLIQNDGTAIRYKVGVGRFGKQWSGMKYIDGKHIAPAWSPPEVVRRDKPSLPDVIPGGSPSNPMGAAAMTLSGGDEYAIHGTNAPNSIGGFVSYGCIRMHNADVMDLFQRVSVGTPVVAVR